VPKPKQVSSIMIWVNRVPAEGLNLVAVLPTHGFAT
jgi:hypothetical protein